MTVDLKPVFKEICDAIEGHNGGKATWKNTKADPTMVYFRWESNDGSIQLDSAFTVDEVRTATSLYAFIRPFTESANLFRVNRPTSEMASEPTETSEEADNVESAEVPVESDQ